MPMMHSLANNQPPAGWRKTEPHAHPSSLTKTDQGRIFPLRKPSGLDEGQVVIMDEVVYRWHDNSDKNKPPQLQRQIQFAAYVNDSHKVMSALRILDVLCLLAKITEDVLLGTELPFKHALREQLPVTCRIGRTDYLVLEPKPPPSHTYYKIEHVVEKRTPFYQNWGSSK
ncbi:hypothetical protein D915_007215 [Fasciola hepatica]|uniref:Uncharacterized protein n=1 Tax=Fasciola hepatica TaxID=6192 RepID=A0A4E0R3G4_FASHE|nr:hypothetical protein D915_007215 [Fasciola hepatica]